MELDCGVVGRVVCGGLCDVVVVVVVARGVVVLVVARVVVVLLGVVIVGVVVVIGGVVVVVRVVVVVEAVARLSCRSIFFISRVALSCLSSSLRVAMYRAEWRHQPECGMMTGFLLDS